MGMQISGRTRNSGKRGRKSPMSEINVTPFVDVMLVLLIFHGNCAIADGWNSG